MRLAIVGASVRATAQSALHAGLGVVGADLFADADLDGFCAVTKIPGARYPEAFFAWLDRQDVDAWMYTGGLENHPELIDRMAMVAPLWGVGGEPLRRCRDPLHLLETLGDAGIEFPETREAEPGAPNEPGWLAKTYRHAGGLGVGRPPSPKEPFPSRLYLQEFVEGEPHSCVYAVTARGGSLLGVTKQLVGDGSTDAPLWSYYGSIGPVRPAPAVSAVLQRLGESLAKRLRLVGLIGVDVIINGDCLTVIEINPRYTAAVEVLERSLGSAGVEFHRRAFNRKIYVETPTRFDKINCKRVVFARRAIHVDERLAAWVDDERRQGRLADAPRVGQVLAAGRPVFTVLADGDDVASAQAMLTQLLSSAERALYGSACV